MHKNLYKLFTSCFCVIAVLVILSSCQSNSTTQQVTSLTPEEHYNKASELMCTCLEKSLKDTSHMLIGAIMNACETESLREYLKQSDGSLKVDTTNETDLNEFSMNISLALKSLDCKAIDVYKSQFWKDATKGKK